MAVINCFAAVTSDPLSFLDYLKEHNEKLHKQVIHLIVFEEADSDTFRLQKLYQRGGWNQEIENDLSLIWWKYCCLHP